MRYITKPISKYGVILQRSQNGEVMTNLSHHIVYHSPDGFEWGYPGSGPTELALNLAERVVQLANLHTEYGTHCSQLAWHAKHAVKELLVINIPEEGTIIPWKLVCYAVMDALKGTDYGNLNRIHLQEYIDKLN